jgi:hypothetical protein
VEHTIEFGGDPERLTVTTSGQADLPGFRRIHEDIVSDERFRPGMPILADHTALQAGGLTTAEVQAIGELTAAFGRRFGTSRVAVVVPDALTFGLVRMAEARAGPTPLRLRIFYSRDEAVAWLSEPQTNE